MISLASLIHHVGQTPLRAGRVALAVICWRSDFEAYARHGKAITGAPYVKARYPGAVRARGPVRALIDGVRLGNIEYRLHAGRLTRRDAEWLAARWQAGVPI